MGTATTPKGTIPPKPPDEKRSTRDLIGELHAMYKEEVYPDWMQNTPEYKAYWAKRDGRHKELKDVLATREHVPGGGESLLKRKANAKKFRGQGKGKNR